MELGGADATKSSIRKKMVLTLIMALVATASGISFPWNDRELPFSLNCTLPPLDCSPPAPAVADFDGDLLLDRAELISNGFQKNIHLTFSSHWKPSLHFSSEIQQPGSIYAEDIDRDSDNDLIWVSDGQLSYTALWLNNGIGELARVSEPAAYAAEIHRLIAGGSREGLIISAVSSWLKAAVMNGFNLLALQDNHHLEPSHTASLNISSHSCAIALSHCVSRYPKRGPPIFSS